MNDYTKNYFYTLLNEMTNQKTYYFRLNGELIQVSEEVFKTVHKEYKHALYEYKTKEPCIELDRDYHDGVTILDYLCSNDNTEEKAINNVLIDMIKSEIAQLELIDRKVITYYFFLQMSQLEIANALGLSQQNVSVRLNKSIKKIRKLLNQ